MLKLDRSSELMAVCSQCQCWVDDGGVCRRCGTSQVEVTAVDVRVAPRLAAQPLRAQRRAAVPRLVALDDDSDHDGEIRRLRAAEITIGRRDADWVFGDDLDMSGQHAKLVREMDSDGHVSWRLIDLSSSNGSFVQMPSFSLASAETLIIGGVLAKWECESLGNAHLRIVESPGDGRSVRIRGQQPVSIGSDPAQSKIVIRHPTVDPQHAELRPSGKAWILDDKSSLNGIWKRVSEFQLQSGTRFLLGEQRFLFHLPESASYRDEAR